MALLTPEQCRTQCRVSGDYADAELAALLDSAVDAVSAHLNRTIFESEEAKAAALDGLADLAQQAEADYLAAVAAAESIASEAARRMAINVAARKLADVRRANEWALEGLVFNGSILAVVRLTLGHLYANRESVVTGVTVAELPLGMKDLLRPYRRVMMP